jgi:hypothetical protein
VYYNKNPVYFFGQATPRFESGIKDLQSLPYRLAMLPNPKISKYDLEFTTHLEP